MNFTPDDHFKELAADAKRQKLMQDYRPNPNAPTPASIGMGEKDIRQFSFFKAIRAALLGGQNHQYIDAAAFELECSAAAAKAQGVQPRGILVPHDILVRELTAGVATDGQELVASNLMAGSFIDALRNAMLVIKAGATMLPGLVGDVVIPRKSSASSATWITTETGNATESEAQFDTVTLTPKTVGAYSDMSRQLLLQSTPYIEALIRHDLAMALALAVDAAALYGSGSDGQPTGVSNTSGINSTTFASAVPTWAEVVEMESLVAADNALAGSLAYLIEPAMRGSLKTVEKGTNSGFIMEDKPGAGLNSYPCLASSQITSGDLFFGNWADLLIGMWGGLDIMADPFTNSLSGALRLVAMQSIDVKPRHLASFCMSNDS